MWSVEIEGPTGWTCRVFWRFEKVAPLEWVVMPVGFEPDLFMPLDCQEALLADLECVRLDRSGSVSALEPSRGLVREVESSGASAPLPFD